MLDHPNNIMPSENTNESANDERSPLIVARPTTSNSSNILQTASNSININNSNSNSNSNNNKKSTQQQQTSFLFAGNIQVSKYQATESSISSSAAAAAANQQDQQPRAFSLYKLWKFAGPGLLISVAYLDPGNLESDLQAGAIAGYKLLWVLMYCTLAGFILQMLSVRLGSTTGLHLAEICHREYGKFTRIFLWIMIEIAIIASDIQQVIGSAIAINILSQGRVEIWVAILITACDVFIFLLLENTGIRVIEGIFATFMTVMGASFLYMYIVAAPDQLQVLKGVIYPWCTNCSGVELKQLVGILGSVVMPHNIYFHSTLVLSRMLDRRSESAIFEANKYFAIESGGAMFFSFLFNLFVTSVSSKSFFNTPDAKNVTLFNAGQFIHDQYGMSMETIWAVGLLSAGTCSTISATYAGQFIMEGFTKINLARWKRIVITRSISIVPCVVVTLLAYGSIDQLNFWCNIIQAVQLPFALLPLLHFTSSRRIMGFMRNNIMLKTTCLLISFGVIGVNIYFLVGVILSYKNNFYTYLFIISILVAYLMFILFFLLGVNNVYRIKLMVRRIFSSYNVVEIDELLHVAPVYKRPDRRQPQQAQPTPQSAQQRRDLISPASNSLFATNSSSPLIGAGGGSGSLSNSNDYHSINVTNSQQQQRNTLNINDIY